MKRRKTKEPQNQMQVDTYQEKGPVQLGPWTSHIWRSDPRHLGFLLARYKFCAKMLAGKSEVLEVGCGDAFGMMVLLQTVESVHGIDYEPMVIEDVKARLAAEGVERCSFSVLDITKRPVGRKFDAAYSLDVIEHIPRESEDRFMANICCSLRPHGVCILGTPNVEAQKYATPASAEGHVNLKSAKSLKELLSRYFHNVFVCSMNDEVIHTGFYPMAQYLLGIGVGVKEQSHTTTTNKATGLHKRKRVLGICDSSASPISLGGLLILAEELQIQRRIHTADDIDVCVVGDAAHSLSVRRTQAGGDSVTLLDSKACKDSALLSTLLDIEGIGACYLSSTIAALQDFLRSSPYPYVTWPTISEHGLVGHKYASTMFVQKFYGENGFIPYLSCKAEPIQWAVDFIRRNVQPYLPVVIHLKNNPNEPGSSNADFDAWLTFFKDCYQQYDVMFILIGNEEIDQRVRKLPNILVARDFGSNLSRDLALIQRAFMFMGMSSGPCNMALFSAIPYVIYKNPDHDVEQMALELGKGDQFPFATPFQKLLRVFETTENLMAEFVNLYTHVNRQDWEKRLANLR